MKKLILIIFMITILVTCLNSVSKADTKFEFAPYECDLFSVKFDAPKDWTVKVTSQFIKFTNPKDSKIQLLFLEDDYYKGKLDGYFATYKERLVKDGLKPYDEKRIKVAGHDAIYIKMKKNNKDLGQIFFIKKEVPRIIVLGTPKGKYKEYEPILMKAIKTIRFYKPYVK
ncbi:MAG: hypothetical protein K8T10_03955 [Candidatus Eremiobacteraeota bacterium]|nr:hypothetical protein [Candidatus Eremiobacteraeota bacterium]